MAIPARRAARRRPASRRPRSHRTRPMTRLRTPHGLEVYDGIDRVAVAGAPVDGIGVVADRSVSTPAQQGGRTRSVGLRPGRVDQSGRHRGDLLCSTTMFRRETTGTAPQRIASTIQPLHCPLQRRALPVAHHLPATPTRGRCLSNAEGGDLPRRMTCGAAARCIPRVRGGAGDSGLWEVSFGLAR